MARNETDDRRNRKAAVEAVLRETRQDLFRFLARHLRSEHEAADVLQNSRHLWNRRPRSGKDA